MKNTITIKKIINNRRGERKGKLKYTNILLI